MMSSNSSPSSEMVESSETSMSSTSSGRSERGEYSAPAQQTSSVGAAVNTSSTAAGVDIVAEYLRSYQREDDKLDELKEKLIEIGVTCLEDLEFVTCEDLQNYIRPIQFRKFQSTLMKEKTGQLNSDHAASGNTEADTGTSTSPLSPVPQAYVLPLNLVPQSLLREMTKKKRLSKDHRLELIRIVGGDLYDRYMPMPTRETCQCAARLLCRTYPEAVKGDGGWESLGNQLLYHAQYQRTKDRNRCTTTPKQEKKNRILKRKSHGIPKDRDMPDLSEKETTASQEQKRGILIEQFALEEKDWTIISSSMASTFPTQRAAINTQANVEVILGLWPFLGKFKYLKGHFYTLMKINEEDCEQRISEMFPKFVKFFRGLGDSKKKGPGSEDIDTLISVVKWHDEQNKANNKKNESNADVLAVTLGLAALMKQKLDMLFLYFDETTSYDEVQAADDLPEDGRPVIAVLGDNAMEASKFMIVVDRRVLYPEMLSAKDAIIGWFMSFYIFKILYPWETAGILEFFQRQVYQIDEEDSSTPKVSRTERKKGRSAPAPVGNKYLGLMRKFHDYCARWEL